MPKIGRWLLLGCLTSVAALKGIPAFLEWQEKKKEQEKFEKYLEKVVGIVQAEHKAYWGDTLPYEEAYDFAKDSYEASKKYNVPHALLIAIASVETGIENMVTDTHLKIFSWGYYSIHGVNHKWLEESLKKDGITDKKLRNHKLLLNPRYQHYFAARFLRDHMNRKKIKDPDSATFVLKYWNINRKHNVTVKNKFHNIRNYLNNREK